jgi:hypothetical protein
VAIQLLRLVVYCVIQVFRHEQQFVVVPGHVMPQPPQLLLSVVVSTQFPLQQVLPVIQGEFMPHLHCPPEQVSPVGAQAVPHIPQLLAFELVSTHVPLQSVGAELGHLQLPLWQVCTPGHTVPHIPQFIESLLRSVQVPLPQLAQPLWQQTPLEQWSPVGHGLPQEWQLFASLWVSTQEPPQHVGASVVHLLPQPPQLLLSVCVLVSQPSVSLSLLQSA